MTGQDRGIFNYPHVQLDRNTHSAAASKTFCFRLMHFYCISLRAALGFFFFACIQRALPYRSVPPSVERAKMHSHQRKELWTQAATGSTTCVWSNLTILCFCVSAMHFMNSKILFAVLLSWGADRFSQYNTHLMRYPPKIKMSDTHSRGSGDDFSILAMMLLHYRRAEVEVTCSALMYWNGRRRSATLVMFIWTE